jgi:large subunit ribosomal protein L28
MSVVCDILGKRRLKGNRVSHANNKKIHFQQPNIQERRLFVPELNVFYRLNVSTSALRTLDKVGGLSNYIMKTDPNKLTPKLKKLRKILAKKATPKAAAKAAH